MTEWVNGGWVNVRWVNDGVGKCPGIPVILGSCDPWISGLYLFAPQLLITSWHLCTKFVVITHFIWRILFQKLFIDDSTWQFYAINCVAPTVCVICYGNWFCVSTAGEATACVQSVKLHNKCLSLLFRLVGEPTKAKVDINLNLSPGLCNFYALNQQQKIMWVTLCKVFYLYYKKWCVFGHLLGMAVLCKTRLNYNHDHVCNSWFPSSCEESPPIFL